jgi:crotonobetainyl-CoA:carnitine CoA-transferase CaiB-like acyl-CoA transferase
MGGLRYVTGFPDRPPVKTGISIGDSIAALWGALGALMALRHKEGQWRRRARWWTSRSTRRCSR